MRTTLALPVLIIVCGVVMWGCNGHSLPSSPSALSPLPVTAGGGRLHALEDPEVPSPLAVIINIVGSFGANAFMPNPTMANMGDQIVFTNSDVSLHHIVLDDGTDLGEVEPGQSSAPVPLLTPTATYHCTIHPSMVGSINGEIAPADPYYPPPDDYYGYY